MKPLKPISLVLALVLLLSMVPLHAAAAQSGENVSVKNFEQNGDVYTINNNAGWQEFCDCLQRKSRYNGFKDKTVKLGADISVTRMACESGYKFMGTFDGNGKTLNVNITSDSGHAAPFIEVENATFRNLNVTGTIVVTKYNSGGIVGYCPKDSTVTFEHCTNSILIDSTEYGMGGYLGECRGAASFTDCVSSVVHRCDEIENGSFVGYYRGTSLSFKGCVFNGKFIQREEKEFGAGGFVGTEFYGTSDVTFEDCLCIPAPLADGEELFRSCSFFFSYDARPGDYSWVSLTDCYYIGDFGGLEEGKPMRTITGGEHITSLELSGTATEYPVSGITGYADNNGLKYGDTYYAGKNDMVALELDQEEITGKTCTSYTASAGTMNGSVLSMPDSDVTVSANYETSRHTVTWIDGDGEIVETDEGVLYDTMPEYNGEPPTKTATSKYTYSFTGWLPEVSKVTSDISYTAQFDEHKVSYGIDRQTEGNGDISSDVDSSVWGETVTLTVAPESDWTLGILTVNDGAIDLQKTDDTHYSFIMPDSDAAVKAVFVPTSSLIFVGDNALTLPEGEGQHYAFIPAEAGYYRFRSESYVDTWVKIYDGDTMIAYDYDSGGNWQFDCITDLQINKVYDVVICSPFASGDVNVNVAPIMMYEVTIDNSDPHGTLSAGNLTNGRAYEGQEVQTFFEADEGYMLVGMTVTSDGQSFEADTFGFVMIAADVTVTPHFGKNYAVTVNADEHVYPTSIDICGLIFGAEEAEVPAGGEAKLYLYFDDGYVPGQITITGADDTDIPYTLSTEGDELIVTFTMPEQEITVTATSKQIICGDANLDGEVDIRDVTAIQRHLAGFKTLTGEALANADTNGDGVVTIEDATHLQMYFAEYGVVLGQVRG